MYIHILIWDNNVEKKRKKKIFLFSFLFSYCYVIEIFNSVCLNNNSLVDTYNLSFIHSFTLS